MTQMLCSAAALALLSSACTQTSLTAPNGSLTKCQVTLTNTSAAPANGGNGSVSVGASPECAWTAATQAAWITELAPASGQGAATIEYKVAANPSTTARQADIVVNNVAAHVSQEASPCRLDVTPRTIGLPTEGGNGSVAVAGAAGCTWTAASQASWLTVKSGQSGNGNGTVEFEATANLDPANDRSGTLLVAGLAVTVSQSARGPCTFSITPNSQSVNDAGGTGSTAVTTGEGCAWTATSNAPWLRINSGTPGNGPGTVAFTIDRNTNTNAQRSGTLTVAGQTFTVNQGPAPCQFNLTQQSQNVSAAGGNVSVIVNTTAGCAWTAALSGSLPWLHITAGLNGSGPGSVAVQVDPNSGGARSGQLQIAGRTATISQAANPCSFSVTPANQQVNALGTNRTVLTLTTPAACGWTASSNVPWIHVINGNGTGGRTIDFSVDTNTNFSARSGAISFSGSAPTVSASIGQDALACNYGLTAPANPQNVPIAGGNGARISFTASPSICPWNASTQTAWIHLVAPTSGTGNGILDWTFEANVGPARSGSISISGQTLTVNQGNGCTYSIPTPPLTVLPSAGSGSFAVATGGGCTWSASTPASWLSITSGSPGTGSGTVTFQIQANTTRLPRSGTFTLQPGGATFTVTQNP